ncbi:MAG: PEP-CTERM system histidine kinase PrsK [Gammaproteobacteria bacterium]|nr:PEP-CTERM system histidine kinase PrsK [Gammaproteobacteria bacterium]
MNHAFNLISADIGNISFLTCAFVYALLSGLLLISASKQSSQDLHSRLLIFSTMITFFWAVLLAWRTVAYIESEILWSAELIRTVSWTAFMYALLNRKEHDAQFRNFRGLFLLITSLLVLHIWIAPHIWNNETVTLWLDIQFIGQMILAICGLVLVEQIYQNIKPEHRWWIKHLCLAVGFMFAYDFYLYANSLMIRHLNIALWDARGAAFALLSPLIMITAARNKSRSVSVQFSRNVVFHSTALIATGIYLVAMGVASHYIAVFGDKWGQVAQIIFLVGAVLLLVVLLLSGTIRAQFRVFFSKHFFNYAYDYREEWLRITSLLSTNSNDQPLEHRAIAAVAESVNSKGGTLWVRDHYGFYRWRARFENSRVNLQRIDPNNPLIQFIKKHRWVVNFEELQRAPELYQGISIEDANWILSQGQAWLLIPLFHRDDLYGLILLTDPQVETPWNWEVIDLLRTAGQQIAGMLALEDAARELTVAKQFEGFNRLSAFLIHDLKNMIAQLSLVVKNAEKHRHNPQFMEDATHTIKHCVNKMNRLMVQLNQGVSSESKTAISLSRVLTEVENQRSQQIPVPEFTGINLDIHVIAEHDRLSSVFSHVIQNAQEAAGRKGMVAVSVVREANNVVIIVQDNGPGMSQAFIQEGLFKPFESTKGLTGMGIGAYESREYILAIGGDVEVDSKIGLGTRFRLVIPIAHSIENKTMRETVSA